jgi:hypothetical protein
MHFEITVVGVGFAGEKAFQLASGCFRTKPFECRFGFCDYRGFALGFAEFDELDRFGDFSLDPTIAVDRLVELCSLSQKLLGRAGIVPQARVLGLRVQLGEATGRGLPVKDASSAAPTTCLCRRLPPEFRRAWLAPC